MYDVVYDKFSHNNDLGAETLLLVLILKKNNLNLRLEKATKGGLQLIGVSRIKESNIF